MPEILEVESARALIEARALGRAIQGVHAPDAWFLKRGLAPEMLVPALVGRALVTARRRGKLLLCDTTDGPVLAMHLGMSGRVLIDGDAAGDPLLYASNRDDPTWRRFGLLFADGGSLHLRDPRRLGAVELDPDEARLGVDGFAVRLADVDRIAPSSRAPVKAVLMDQARIAGLGNLLTDEILWRADIDPARPASSLDADERRRLARSIGTTLRTLGRRGGSHTGDHMVGRFPGGVCPRDGTELLVRSIGGRTTYSCPVHQR